MVRLGPLYAARTGDTLLSIALKFGVTVNQLFFWNQHLRDAEV
jgi:LysM repeat protein